MKFLRLLFLLLLRRSTSIFFSLLLVRSTSPDGDEIWASSTPTKNCEMLLCAAIETPAIVLFARAERLFPAAETT